MNNPKPYYKSKYKNKRKHIKTNLKGPIRVWVPNNETIFAACMMKRRKKPTILVPGQRLLTTYNKRKTYVINPNSEGGKECGIWKKPARRDN